MKILIGALVAFLLFVGGYWKGTYDKGMEVAVEVANANDKAREQEQQLAQVATTYASVLRKKETNAQKEITSLRTAVASGERRLFIPTQAPDCSVQPTTDTSPASGSDTGEARAELDRKVADSLIALTAEGDTAIRKLNACIEQYNTIKERLNDSTIR
jgi:hypothetical protein